MKVCSICQRCYADATVSCVESEHPELSETRAGSPEMIAGYRLDLLLESGIKGEVYRGLRIDSDQSCLIKIVAANEENKQKFLQDAKTATTLFNQSVVDVYEFGSLESGEVFVVAEDPAGQTVRELLNNVVVPQLLTTVQVVRQTAEAVHTLHLSGLTHRAIRPENIILTTDAEHRLLVRIQNPDLGGVAEHSIVSNKFLIDTAADSLRYFAPEQFSGEGASVKTDVYSLGIVLYEMLAGTPPFDSDKASGLIDMHRNRRPPDVTIDNFDLRMLLTHTLMESLQKQPGKRQSSANAFARQLRHIEQLATHSPTPPAAGTVPPAPSLVNVAAASASASVAPRVMVVSEPPREIQMGKIQPVTARVEGKQVPTKVEPEAISFKAEPESLPINEIEIIPEVNLVVQKPILTSSKMESEPHKSRLKRLKKQLHSFTAPLAASTSAEPPTPPVIEAGQEESSIASACVTPRRMELEQPVDDIPSSDSIFSLDERLEARPTAEPRQEVPVVSAMAAVAAALAPRKIEWEQPEDDIPSLGDASEALVTEPIAPKPMVPKAQVSAEPVSRVPRKVEWETPDEDIPSMEDVLEVLAMEQIGESAFVEPVAEDVPAAPPLSVAKKVEWGQPDHDIPSMEDAVLANEQMQESAFVSPTFEEAAVATPLIAPKKIEWAQPDDDIPSMKDVMEVLATEQIVENAWVPPVAEEVHAAPPILVPTKIDWVQPEDDIPSMEEAMEVLSMQQTAEVPIVQADAEEVEVAGSYNEPTAVESVNVSPVAEPEPEEITLVSPPRRIKIDWEQPKPWETLSKEIEFYPTLLGDVDTKRKANAESEPFFSDYYAEAEPRSSDHYRSLMIGTGFIALIVLFLFGNDSVWNYLQNGNPADSVAVKTTSATQTFPQSGQTTTPNDQRILKSFEKPKSGDDVATGESKPSAIKVSASSSDEASPAEKTRAQNKDPQTATSGKNAGKTPLVPSTLVISSDDGKISSKVEPLKRSANKKQGSSGSTEPTRPRIVENPQP